MDRFVLQLINLFWVSRFRGCSYFRAGEERVVGELINGLSLDLET
jgi:hypothetical protein